MAADVLRIAAATGDIEHKITRQEIVDLLGVIERDLKDAQRDLSADWKFGIAYNAALQLCTILLNASGYRPEKLQAHYRTLQSLPLILGAERKDRRGLPRHLPQDA